MYWGNLSGVFHLILFSHIDSVVFCGQYPGQYLICTSTYFKYHCIGTTDKSTKLTLFKSVWTHLKLTSYISTIYIALYRVLNCKTYKWSYIYQWGNEQLPVLSRPDIAEHAPSIHHGNEAWLTGPYDKRFTSCRGRDDHSIFHTSWIAL